MNEHNNYPDWDEQYYGTGPTQPPKDKGGVLALMLILVIFLSGIVTVLGILNIRLFQELQVKQKEADLSIAFTTEAVTEEAAVPVPASVAQQTEPVPFASMNIQQSPQSIDNVPMEGGLPLQEIYTQNIPSVVSISCTGYGGASTGTGVVLSADGYIVTNAHVVDGAGSISVRLTDDRVFAASIVGLDEISDLAVLFIQAADLTPASFGDSASLRVGDTVVAIGDPLGEEFRGTYTNGIVSAINRDVDMDGRTMTLIQTNAALNSGNSGGPLINCYGQVIGINTMKIGAFTDKAGVEGLGFAIPSATVKEIVDQLVSQGYVSGRPTLGLEGDSLSTFYQHYYRMPAGLYITYVAPGSDAYSKGIEDGDILLSINDKRITSMEELKSVIFDCEVGQTVQVIIYRSGQQYRLELTLAEDKG
ncbi:MAG: trypsin-like peptidase domain-containing protein [Oscillospiraceae bacterium]|nr:trypsin-like peptidase domain-containing protein [Oscillospiraceae bacterium]MBQ7130834.1 trypsin-like peptidase domain-containing protein [Oscillospiraceae bacterium]